MRVAAASMVAMAAMMATESTVAVLVAMMPMALPRADVPSVMETAFGEYSGGVGGNDAHGVA